MLCRTVACALRSVSKRKIFLIALLLMLMVSLFSFLLIVDETTTARTPQLQAAENLQTNPTKTQIQTVDSLQAPKESMKVYENGVRIQLVSPQQGARYYDVVPLSFTATYTRLEEVEFYTCCYTVDGILHRGEDQTRGIFKTQLDLPPGEHRLRISVDALTRAQVTYAESTGILPFIGVASGAVEVSFFVEPYPLSFFSLTVDVPQNLSSPQLIFSVSRSVAWAGYNVDGSGNVTVPTTTSPSLVWGNAALAGLSAGWHNVTVYATDLEGRNEISETITFKVTEPFPTSLVTAIVILVLVVAVGAVFVFYFKKRKR